MLVFLWASGIDPSTDGNIDNSLTDKYIIKNTPLLQ